MAKTLRNATLSIETDDGNWNPIGDPIKLDQHGPCLIRGDREMVVQVTTVDWVALWKLLAEIEPPR